MDPALAFAIDVVDQVVLLLPEEWNVAYLRPDWPIVTETSPRLGRRCLPVSPRLRTTLFQRALTYLVDFHERVGRRAVEQVICRRADDVFVVDVIFVAGPPHRYAVRDEDRLFIVAFCSALEDAPEPEEARLDPSRPVVAVYEAPSALWIWRSANPIYRRALELGGRPGWRAFSRPHLHLEPAVARWFASVASAKLGAPLVIHRAIPTWFITTG